MSGSRAGLKSGPYRESGRAEAGVDCCGLELKIEDQAVVQEFLDVEGHLRPVNGAVVGKPNFDGDVEEHVIVGMYVEGQGDREERGRVEVQINLAEMLEGFRIRAGNRGKVLANSEMLDCERVFGFLADVGDDITRGGEPASDDENREKPSGLAQKVVQGDVVAYAVWAKPGSGRSRTGREELRSSLRGPEGKLKSRRLAPETAFNVAVPVSSSEPAMRRAVPVSVTSETEVAPASAAKALWRSTGACAGGAGDCWAVADRTRARQRYTTPRDRRKCMKPSCYKD